MVKRGNKMAIVRAVEQGENLVNEPYFKAADRVIHLDVPPAELERRRDLRDKGIEAGTSTVGFGRKSGSTKYAGKDFSAAEARVAEEFKGARGVKNQYDIVIKIFITGCSKSSTWCHCPECELWCWCKGIQNL